MSGILRWFNVNKRLFAAGSIGLVTGIGIFAIIYNLTLEPDGVSLPPKPFKVAAAGDWGCGYNAESTVKILSRLNRM